jgi:TATA-box binding protein (TBP) (component of TFIID and TFIIIB)
MTSDILSDPSFIDLKKKIENTLELNIKDIPKDVNISTMTLEAKFNTHFYPWNIYRFIKKSNDSIISVVKENRNKKDKKIINNDDSARVENAKNNKLKKNSKNKVKNKQSEIFLNQVTISIKVSNKEKPVSVKIFNSGTVHFTGCINVNNLLEAAYKLCIECRKEIAIMNKYNKIIDVKFAKDINQLYVDKLFDFKVDMINCIFNAPFTIDRPSLQILLKSDGYNASYDSNGHAGVKIKYVSTGEKITIFIFESGAIIIILGKQGFKQIYEVYNFIYKYLLSNYEMIVKDNDITVYSILKQFKEDNSDIIDIKKIENALIKKKKIKIKKD